MTCDEIHEPRTKIIYAKIFSSIIAKYYTKYPRIYFKTLFSRDIRTCVKEKNIQKKCNLFLDSDYLK